MHAVHGDEVSSSDAALMEAYHLLAARGDAAVDAILRESIVIIDPLQNPDGRARFVSTNLQGEAATPDAEPYAVERDQPWPGGRYNHYLFDMNRDWFAQTQPETRGRAALYREFWPHVVVDLHEMGGESSYYFAPPADPINPLITKNQQKWFDAFGRANGAMFDARGFAYFIREVYDSFYPGYGESWPIFQGAVGMTYEQASARGLRYRREDGAVLSYHDGVLHHFTAAITTAETAAKNRAAILRDFYDYRRSAVSEGETGPVREYLLVPGVDPSRAERLARLLATQGIEVSRAVEPFRLGTRTLPAGTWVVPAAQPSGRLVRNLLDREILQPEAFLKEQDRRRVKRLGDQIYDVTAWSLPLAFDVEVVTADRPTPVKATPMAQYLAAVASTAQAAAGAPAGAPPKVGFLVPWGSATASLVADALRQGIRLRSADLPFTLGGRAYAAGTVLARTAENAATMPAALAALARTHGVELVRIDTAFVDSGMSLGSGSMVALKAPRVVMAWDTGTQPMSAGWTRYTLERRFGQPVTAVRVGSLGRVDFTRVDVLVLPSGTYTGDRRRRPAPPQGLDQRRRHADHDRRGVAVGGARQRRPAVDVDRAEGRQARGRAVSTEKPGDKTEGGLGVGGPDRLREGDPAGARAAGRHPGRAAARHARSRALAVVGHRRRDPGDGRRAAHLHAAEAGQGPQRRHLRQGRRAGGERPGVERRADAVRQQAVPDGSAARRGARHRLRRGPELPRLHRGDVAAVHQRGAAGAGALRQRCATSTRHAGSARYAGFWIRVFANVLDVYPRGGRPGAGPRAASSVSATSPGHRSAQAGLARQGRADARRAARGGVMPRAFASGSSASLTTVSLPPISPPGASADSRCAAAAARSSRRAARLRP